MKKERNRKKENRTAILYVQEIGRSVNLAIRGFHTGGNKKGSQSAVSVLRPVNRYGQSKAKF